MRTRSLSLLAPLFLLAGLLVATPRPVAAQAAAVRFELRSLGDTSFTFALDGQSWVRRGLRGIVVDPRRRDVLVARFRVVGVGDGTARAVLTGQTTPLEDFHVALITRPRTPWYRQATFWAGVLVGGAVGVVAAQ